MTKTLIIIPAYNESGSIKEIIKEVQEYNNDYDICVVDDASTDDTYDKALSTGVIVLSLPINLGIGGAMQTGYKYAAEHNYDYAIQLDGDGQHIPTEIDKLFTAQEKTKADLIIGSRFIPGSITYEQSFLRRLGGRFFSFVISTLTRIKTTDPTSGFRLVNKNVINLFVNNYPPDYPEVEVIVTLHRHNMKITETPVNMRARETGASSIRYFKTGYYMFKVTLAVMVDILRSADPDFVKKHD